MKGLEKVNSELRRLHTGDYYTSGSSLTEEQKNSNQGFFISLLLGSCISPGERQQQQHFSRVPEAAAPSGMQSPDPDLPPDQEPPPTYPEETPQQKAGTFQSFLQDSTACTPKNDRKAQLDGEE